MDDITNSMDMSLSKLREMVMLSLGWEGIQVGWHPRVGEPVLAHPQSPQCRPADTALTVAVHVHCCESASLGVHGQGL